MAALLIHPSAILANSPESPPEEDSSSEQIESESKDHQQSSDHVPDIIDPELQETDTSNQIPEIDDSRTHEPEPEIDPDFLVDPDAQPLDPESPSDELPPATGSDIIDPIPDQQVPEEFVADPLDAPEVQSIETQADEPYIGSIPLSFSNDSKDQILILHDLSVILQSGMTQVSYTSNFHEMGVTSRNIAFLIKDVDSGEEVDLLDLNHGWELMPGESLNLEIHIKVSCTAHMYSMKNEIIYDYHYEVDPSLIENQETETPEVPIPIPDPETGIDEELPIDPEQPSLMPEIPDESFDEDMMVVPEPSIKEPDKELKSDSETSENKTQLIENTIKIDDPDKMVLEDSSKTNEDVSTDDIQPPNKLADPEEP